MNKEQLEREILDLFSQILPRGVKKSAVRLDADFKSELGIDSIALFSLVDLIERSLGIDLFACAERLAEARRVAEVVEIANGVAQSKHVGIA